MFIFRTGQLTNPKYIINFPTKRHWRDKSRIEDIDSWLIALVDEISSRDIHSIAIPPLGSGLGGLDWSNVRPRIECSLRKLEHLRVVIFWAYREFELTQYSTKRSNQEVLATQLK